MISPNNGQPPRAEGNGMAELIIYLAMTKQTMLRTLNCIATRFVLICALGICGLAQAQTFNMVLENPLFANGGGEAAWIESIGDTLYVGSAIVDETGTTVSLIYKLSHDGEPLDTIYFMPTVFGT